jgi:hypothetical protein
MLENTEGAIKNWQSKETGNITGTQDDEKQNTTEHNMCWTPLCVNTHLLV